MLEGTWKKKSVYYNIQEPKVKRGDVIRTVDPREKDSGTLKGFRRRLDDLPLAGFGGDLGGVNQRNR